tara:strand:- start:11623 stop:12669 length:1047 start_codon:yes stop_codon:yes gene_type:complete
MSENTSHSEEEIDLGQLFTLIGKGIGKIGDGIKFIFYIVLNALLGVFNFFSTHFIKFVIAGTVGLVAGWIIDNTKTPEFEASLVVKPNYQSGRQLYKNVAFYDELIQQEKFDLIASTFGITIEEANSLISFEIAPDINENYMLQTYDNFLSTIDSTVALNFEYDAYTDNFKDYSYSEHEITVLSTQSDVFPKLESTIISGVMSNEFFQQLEESERQILSRNEDYLKTSLLVVDTLRKVYTDVMIKESEKPTSQGTNINMASSNESSKELDLFNEENRINSNIDQLKRTQVKDLEILNVVSSFQKIGFRRTGISNLWLFKAPFALCTLLFLGLVFIDIKSLVLRKELEK